MAEKRGPKTVRRDNLTEIIRNRIVSGEWKPGERLPNRAYFQENYGSANLINKAFQNLFEEGILELCSSRKNGTRVNPEPPFLTRYAVLLNGTWDQMDSHTRAVYEAAQRLIRKGKKIELHYDLDREYDDPEHIKLHNRILHHEFAGVYRETLPQRKQIGDLREQNYVPVVRTLQLRDDLPNFAIVNDELPVLLAKKAFHYLRERGAKNVAVFYADSEYHPEKESDFQKFAHQEGVNIPQRYFQTLSLYSYSLVIPALRALLASENPDLPDAIFFQNDNFLPYAMPVFNEFTDPRIVRMPIAAIGNYPYLPQFNHPIRYFCYDHLAMMEDGFRFIDSFRRGETVSRELSSIDYEGDYA